MVSSSTVFFLRWMKHRLGGGWVQYISLVGWKLPQLDGYVAVCLVLTVEVYANINNFSSLVKFNLVKLDTSCVLPQRVTLERLKKFAKVFSFRRLKEYFTFCIVSICWVVQIFFPLSMSLENHFSIVNVIKLFMGGNLHFRLNWNNKN